jgi:hypothetical protein
MGTDDDQTWSTQTWSDSGNTIRNGMSLYARPGNLGEWVWGVKDTSRGFEARGGAESELAAKSAAILTADTYRPVTIAMGDS